MSLTRVPSNDPRLGPGAVPQLTRSINKMTTEKSKFSSPRVQISPLRVQISPLRAQISPLRVQISPLRVQICRASFKRLCNSPVSLRHGVVLSFKQHSSKEGQAKLNPKTAKRSQHSMKDREKKQSSKLNLFSLNKMRQMRHQISERQILPQMY